MVQVEGYSSFHSSLWVPKTLKLTYLNHPQSIKLIIYQDATINLYNYLNCTTTNSQVYILKSSQSLKVTPRFILTIFISKSSKVTFPSFIHFFNFKLYDSLTHFHQLKFSLNTIPLLQAKKQIILIKWTSKSLKLINFPPLLLSSAWSSSTDLHDNVR